MQEIDFSVLDRSQLRSIFPGLHMNMIIDAVEARNCDGRLWTLNADDPEIFSLLWDKHRLYLAGRGHPAHLQPAFGEFVRAHLREVVPSNERHIAMCPLSAQTQSLPAGTFGADLVGSEMRRLYRYPSDRSAPEVDTHLDISFMSIDAGFLNLPLSDTAPVEREIRLMWPSRERYLQNGWGTAAVVSGEVTCWCTAEFVSENFCGIGIETLPRMRGRGLATATGARFIDQALARQCTPHWECSAENAPSVRVAEKLGFQVVEYPSILMGRLG